MEEDFPTFIGGQITQWMSDAADRLGILQASRGSVADLVISLQTQLTGAQAQLDGLDASLDSLTQQIAAAPVLANTIATAVDAASGVKEVPVVPVSEVVA